MFSIREAIQEYRDSAKTYNESAEEVNKLWNLGVKRVPEDLTFKDPLPMLTLEELKKFQEENERTHREHQAHREELNQRWNLGLNILSHNSFKSPLGNGFSPSHTNGNSEPKPSSQIGDDAKSHPPVSPISP